MKKSNRLQRIADLSETAEQLAAQALARASEEVERIERQLQDLESYRDEYLRPLREPGGGGLGAYQAQKLRLFVGKIEEALALLLVVALRYRVRRSVMSVMSVMSERVSE